MTLQVKVYNERKKLALTLACISFFIVGFSHRKLRIAVNGFDTLALKKIGISPRVSKAHLSYFTFLAHQQPST